MPRKGGQFWRGSCVTSNTDDIMRAADPVESARASNIKMYSVMNSKQLALNQDKTGFILFGKKDKVDKGSILLSLACT